MFEMHAYHTFLTIRWRVMPDLEPGPSCAQGYETNERFCDKMSNFAVKMIARYVEKVAFCKSSSLSCCL